MMQAFRRLVRVYCMTCIAAGVLQEFLPGENKKILRSVTGLYMIVAIILCIRQIPFSQIVQPPPTETIESTTQTDPDEIMLNQVRQQLERSCETLLQKHDIQAKASVELQLSPQGEITIRQIRLKGEPTEEAQAILSAFSAQEILWETGDAYG